MLLRVGTAGLLANLKEIVPETDKNSFISRRKEKTVKKVNKKSKELKPFTFKVIQYLYVYQKLGI